MFITAGPGTKLCAGGHGGSEGHVLRDTTSRGLRGQVSGWPPRTSERGDEEVVSQEEGECCCASAIAIAHMRAHWARENSTRLGRVALTGGPEA
jgi:hypothetical protein